MAPLTVKPVSITVMKAASDKLQPARDHAHLIHPYNLLAFQPRQYATMIDNPSIRVYTQFEN